MPLGTFQCGLCPVPIRLECVQPILEHLIKVRQPVLDQPVQALKLVVGYRSSVAAER